MVWGSPDPDNLPPSLLSFVAVAVVSVSRAPRSDSHTYKTSQIVFYDTNWPYMKNSKIFMQGRLVVGIRSTIIFCVVLVILRTSTGRMKDFYRAQYTPSSSFHSVVSKLYYSVVKEINFNSTISQQQHGVGSYDLSLYNYIIHSTKIMFLDY